MDRSTPKPMHQLLEESRARLKEQAGRIPYMKARFLAGSPATTPQECLDRHGKTFEVSDLIFDQVAPCNRPYCACLWVPDVTGSPYGIKRTIK